MSNTNGKKLIGRLLCVATMGVAMLYTVSGFAAAPGITGGATTTPTFNLVAEPAYISQPDGASIYSWGYGCDGAPAGFAPANITTATCTSMQIPGPTLIVHEGDTVTVTLRNNLPAAAGNTSILFPGFDVTATGGSPGILTQEAMPGATVTYTFTATKPGTRAYYSGTQGDVQVEMGLYGAIIVLPNTVPATCHAVDPSAGATLPDGQPEYRLAASAYDHPETCYDREYLFQLSELDPAIHSQAEAQANLTCTTPSPGGCMTIQTEPYHPAYFLLNGRSMPDNFDPNYSVQYPHQPYNGNPHAHPGELVLMRFIGTGRWQHPFHEHGNHLRMLAHDGNLMVSQTDPANKLGGKVLFTTTTTPGQAFDAIFYWTGRGLNWDIYGHVPPDPTNPNKPGTVYNVAATSNPDSVKWNGLPVQCIPDADGYFTDKSDLSLLPTSEQGLNIYAVPNYHEWCEDHDKPLEKKPFGAVGAGGPVTLPDSNLLTNGAWYGGSPYLGPDATQRAIGPTSTTPPTGTVGNPPSSEAGYAFIWHSHNERELTTNNVFPGGIMTMFMVDPQVFVINETK